MRIALIGTGVMGAPMADRLLAAGHTVLVYNRTQAKAQPLVDKGAEWAATPAEAAATADVAITMVTDMAAVRDVTLGGDGILGALSTQAVHCDMSTVTPRSAAEIAGMYRDNGKRYVQAPVLGSKKQVSDGTLIIFGGGPEKDIDRAAAAWNAFAGKTWRFETPEQAMSIKLACNMMISQMILTLGQSLLFAKAGGVDPNVALEIIQSSNLAAPMYGSKGKTLIEGNFNPNFFVRHMLKDLGLAAQAAADVSLPQPMNAVARELFVSAVAQGHADEDYSAVVKVLESLTGTTISDNS